MPQPNRLGFDPTLCPKNHRPTTPAIVVYVEACAGAVVGVEG